MFDKEIFKTELLNFVKNVLPICENNLEKLIIEELKEPVFFSNGKYKKFTILKKQDYDFFIKKTLANEIIMLNEYKLLVKFFVTSEFNDYNSKLLSKSYDDVQSKPNFAKELPLKFLVEYLNQTKNFSLDRKKFNIVFKNFFQFLENLLLDEYITPLFNFESNIGKKGIIINGITIRKINSNEFLTFSNLEENVHLPKIYHEVTHVMAIKHSSSDLSSGYDIVKEKFQRIIDSLSLLKNGNPQFGGIYRNLNNPWIHYDSKYEIEVISKEPLIIKTINRNSINKIYNDLEKIDFSKKSNKFLEIAKKRFISGLTRSSEFDQLIDLIISLESLYVSSPGEITIRLSNRMAIILGKNDIEREHIWKFIKKVYNLRSGIVHGEGLRTTEIDGKKYSLDEIIQKLIELNRKSLLVYIRLVNRYTETNKIDKISDDIDKSLINRSFLKKNFGK